jgi:hypothetical protein
MASSMETVAVKAKFLSEAQAALPRPSTKIAMSNGYRIPHLLDRSLFL